MIQRTIQQDIAIGILRGRYYRGYYVTSRATYKEIMGKDLIEDMMLCINEPDSGTLGEFCFEWSILGGKRACRIKMFDDVWQYMPLFQDVFGKMPSIGTTSSTDAIDPKLFEVMLQKMGFVDVTNYHTNDQPYGNGHITGRQEPKPLDEDVPFYVLPVVRVSECPFAHLFKDHHEYLVPMGGRWDGEIISWLNQNCTHDYLTDRYAVFFQSPEDAMLCQLAFA